VIVSGVIVAAFIVAVIVLKYRRFGLILARAGNVREATQHVAKAVEIEPMNGTARDNLQNANAILRWPGTTSVRRRE